MKYRTFLVLYYGAGAGTTGVMCWVRDVRGSRTRERVPGNNYHDPGGITC